MRNYGQIFMKNVAFLACFNFHETNENLPLVESTQYLFRDFIMELASFFKDFAALSVRCWYMTSLSPSETSIIFALSHRTDCPHLLIKYESVADFKKTLVSFYLQIHLRVALIDLLIGLGISDVCRQIDCCF